jgi:hypothetical protein
MRNRKIVRRAVDVLALTAKIKILVVPGYVIHEGMKIGGYYTLAFNESIGHYHHITVSSMWNNAEVLIVHELIHAWQTENQQWGLGHGVDFKTACVILATELDLNWKDIYAY